jgi:SOS-response transcriptional repressor LexA
VLNSKNIALLLNISNNDWEAVLFQLLAKNFGLKVNGLSMIEKGIFDGDIAIIKKTNIVLNGKIAAVLTSDNEITLKTIKIKENKISDFNFIFFEFILFKI